MRPLRPETDRRSRPLSGHLKLGRALTVPSSPPPDISTNDLHTPVPLSLPVAASNGDGDYDEPPPLPVKQQHSDYANLLDALPSYGSKTRVNSAMARLGPHKQREKVSGAESTHVCIKLHRQ